MTFYTGSLIAKNELQVPANIAEPLLKKYQTPYPCIAAGITLRGRASSAIDISDGLASEIFHICTQSEVGCNIFEEKIPIDPDTFLKAQDFGMSSTIVALNGGEDYELLFTVKQSDFEKIKGNPHLTIIGHMTDKNSGVNLITRDGSSTPLTAQGWDAFLKKEDK